MFSKFDMVKELSFYTWGGDGGKWKDQMEIIPSEGDHGKLL